MLLLALFNLWAFSGNSLLVVLLNLEILTVYIFIIVSAIKPTPAPAAPVAQAEGVAKGARTESRVSAVSARLVIYIKIHLKRKVNLLFSLN